MNGSGFENMTNDQVAQLAALCVQELARRAEQPVQEQQSPLQALLSNLTGGQQRTQPQAAPVYRQMRRDGQAPATFNSQRITAKIATTAKTDPEAAAVFAGRGERMDGVPPINGNGAGMGGEADIG